jgi:hypothetical protein
VAVTHCRSAAAQSLRTFAGQRRQSVVVRGGVKPPTFAFHEAVPIRIGPLLLQDLVWLRVATPAVSNADCSYPQPSLATS